MPPPPPVSLPKSAPTGQAKATGAGYGAPPAAPSSLPSRPAPPAPGALPSKAPAAPKGVPGAPKALPKAEAKGRAAPPPPRALPGVGARAGPSDSGFSAPPPPASLPTAPSAPSRPAPGAPTGIPAAPSRPAPPSAPTALPSGAPGAAAGAPPAAEPAAAVAEEHEEDAHDESWREYLEDETDESLPNDSGDDSDEASTAPHGDRHKNDMELLMKMQAKSTPKGSGVLRGHRATCNRWFTVCNRTVRPARAAERKTSTTSPSTREAEEVGVEEELVSQGGTADETVATAGGYPAQKKGLMSRLFGSKQKHIVEIPPGTSMLGQDLSKRGDTWYEQELARLGKDGIRCTKVGTNGKPYERFVYLDSRNLTLEIRGGRSGTSGVMMDDLVDIRQGLSSPDFQQFVTKLHMDPHGGLESKSLVLQTPHRTFSFIMSDQSQRDTCGYCILYLLKIKNRGVMAASSSPAVKASQGPKSGTGKVTYPNRSTYEGQFNNSMRHGQGVLTLSDGTRYVAQWKNDERHGEGKEFCPDGTTFEGHYVAGMRHGYGVMKWPEGSKYSGMFERGRANGQGELLRTDGSVYKGQFCEDCMSGEGRMRWRDGVEYIGQFVANKREGYGTMTWMSGRWKKYSGQWKDGMQNEIGVLVDHNDQEFKGYFKMGKLDYWIDDR
ncbi:unnamed protein product [Durusdinium trenchii]|uniref:Uncharacterized protein n=1 Tax=Durusdinium trenchii TaxID=1381693 RepID=A0ABP0JHJ2_9DINO